MSVRRASLLLSLHTLVAATTSTTSTSSPTCIRPRRPRTSFSSPSSVSFSFASPPHSAALSSASTPPSSVSTSSLTSPLARCIPALSRLSRRRPSFLSLYSNLPQASFISRCSTSSPRVPSSFPLAALSSSSPPSSSIITSFIRTSRIAAAIPFHVASASLCMVCQSTASSDDAVPPASNHPLVPHNHDSSSSSPSVSSPISNTTTCSVTHSHSSPSSSFHPLLSLHTTTSSTLPAQSSDPTPSVSSKPSPNSSKSISSDSITHSPHGDSTRESSNDHESESDTALSTSTVTSVDLGEVPASDSSERRDPRVRMTFHTGVAFVPHPEKRDKGGEDAFFTQDHALGVFDGVGGWSSVGVDAGLYSKELARLTSLHIEHNGPSSAVEALKSATTHNHAIGSSTACVVGLDADRLVGVNLGDSGLIVIRRGDIVYRTNEQQHYFNCPYQVGTDSIDTIDIGAPIEFTLQNGDCIIMGTDGLWDNVFPNEVVQIVISHGVATNSTCSQTNQPSTNSERTKSTPNDMATDASSMVSDCVNENMNVSAKDVQVVAEKLAEAAIRVANDERGTSPFSVNAQNAGHMFLGGKVDDITILAALVVDVGSFSDTMDKESPTSVMDSSGFDSKNNPITA